MPKGLDEPIYEPILQEIKTMPHVNIRKDGMADNEGHDAEWAEIVVGFDTIRKRNWRGLLFGETEPIANLEDVREHIQHTCGYRPVEANDRRLFYKIKERIDGKEKLLYCLEVSTVAIFI